MLLVTALAIALAGCPPPPPPPADHLLTSPRWIKNTLVTQYWPAPERWFGGPLVRVAGIPGRHRSEWLFGAHGLPMEGEGIASNGRVYHFAGPYDIGWVNRSGGGTAPCRHSPGNWTNGRPFWLASPGRAKPGGTTKIFCPRSVRKSHAFAGGARKTSMCAPMIAPPVSAAVNHPRLGVRQ